MVIRHIFLTGMPGSGKSFWGERWAVEHDWSFGDLDVYIEQATNKSIPEIFSEERENGFRMVETNCLKRLVEELDLPTIIACGGGTILSEENRTIMRQHGCIIYLKADTELLVERLRTQQHSRPLLRSATELRGDLATMLQMRKSLYEQADITVDAAGINEQTFTQIGTTCTALHS